MARNSARWGRLRRVLNEDLAANSYPSADALATHEPGDTPRYAAGANIENHPQVTDFVPRRYRTIASVLVTGLAAASAVQLAAQQLQPWLADSAATIELSEYAGRITAWATAAVLLVLAAYARLVLSLRRHRVDDYRGRYRVWGTASVLAVVLSANAVVGMHVVVADTMHHLTGWSLLSNNAGAWLIPATLIGGFVLLKLVVDVAECRLAMVALASATACYAASAVEMLGHVPVVNDPWVAGIFRSLPFAGSLLLLAGILLYARYLVLDVQGLIEHARPEPGVTAQEDWDGESDPHGDSRGDAADDDRVAAQGDTEWIDGSEPEQDDPLESQRMSKSERKRLRKQQSRNRAA